MSNKNTTVYMLAIDDQPEAIQDFLLNVRDDLAEEGIILHFDPDRHIARSKEVFLTYLKLATKGVPGYHMPDLMVFDHILDRDENGKPMRTEILLPAFVEQVRSNFPRSLRIALTAYPIEPCKYISHTDTNNWFDEGLIRAVIEKGSPDRIEKQLKDYVKLAITMFDLTGREA